MRLVVYSDFCGKACNNVKTIIKYICNEEQDKIKSITLDKVFTDFIEKKINDYIQKGIIQNKSEIFENIIDNDDITININMIGINDQPIITIIINIIYFSLIELLIYVDII